MNTTKLLSIAAAVIGTGLLGFLGYRKMSSEYKKDEEIDEEKNDKTSVELGRQENVDDDVVDPVLATTRREINNVFRKGLIYILKNPSKFNNPVKMEDLYQEFLKFNYTLGFLNIDLVNALPKDVHALEVIIKKLSLYEKVVKFLNRNRINLEYSKISYSTPKEKTSLIRIHRKSNLRTRNNNNHRFIAVYEEEDDEQLQFNGGGRKEERKSAKAYIIR